MSEYKYTVTEELDKQRIDKVIAGLCPDFSRSQIQKAIKEKNVKVNNSIVTDLSGKVKANDLIEIVIKEKIQEHLTPANIPLDIIYEDNDLIVINKTAGMTVHPGAGDSDKTLVNALLYYTKDLSDAGGEFRPGIVHRLDKDTSGLMVVAKNNSAHMSLASQIETRQLEREYQALIWGVMNPIKGIIDIAVARSRSDRTKMTTVKNGGKRAITNYSTLEIFCGGIFSLAQCKLGTGRTHQIRVHLSHSKHSIVGDQTYGNNNRKIAGLADDSVKQVVQNIRRQALHSYYIAFDHPRNNNRMQFEVALPPDINRIITMLRNITLG